MKYLFLGLLIFLGITKCAGQSNPTFRNLPIIPFETPKGDREIDSIRKELYDGDNFKLGRILRSRARALDFFETMTTLAEPTTVSFLPLDWTFSDNKNEQKKPYVLNADIKMPISLGGKRWKMNTIQIIPQFKVRILQNDTIKHDDRSLPVRTPSYMPGVAWFFSHRYFWKRDTINNSLKGYYGGIHAYHHSNGQDGPEYVNAEIIQRFNLTTLNPGQINVYNGNFSEIIVFDFIVGGTKEFYARNITPLYLKRKKKIPKQMMVYAEPKEANRLFYWRTSYEWHEKNHLTNSKFRQAGLYGRDRINVQLGYAIIPTFRDIILAKGNTYVAVTPYQSKELFRFIMNLNYLTNAEYYAGDLNNKERVKYSDLTKRLNINLTGYWRITGAPNAAFFMQLGRYGSDNYNIYFQQSMWQLRGGIAMAFFKYPRAGDLSKNF